MERRLQKQMSGKNRGSQIPLYSYYLSIRLKFIFPFNLLSNYLFSFTWCHCEWHKKKKKKK